MKEISYKTAIRFSGSKKPLIVCGGKGLIYKHEDIRLTDLKAFKNIVYKQEIEKLYVN